jgi:hypothetical protein
MEKQEKPLEKMTAKELREIALEIPDITGVHAMKKDELLEAIRKSRGVEKEEKEEAKEEKEEAKEEKEEAKKEKGVGKKVEKKAEVSVADLKKKIRECKALKEEAVKKGDVRMAKIYKRRINRLKKRTRKAA